MLHHVSLEVLPADASRFGELLEVIGFATAETPGAVGDSVRWYGREGTQVHLILTPEARAPTLGHAAFVASAFEPTLAELRDRGFAVEKSRQLWGERRAFVIAPSGHRLELMAAPPG